MEVDCPNCGGELEADGPDFINHGTMWKCLRCKQRWTDKDLEPYREQDEDTDEDQDLAADDIA